MSKKLNMFKDCINIFKMKKKGNFIQKKKKIGGNLKNKIDLKN